MSGSAVRFTAASGATGPPPGAVAGVLSATSERAVGSALQLRPSVESVPAVPATWHYSLRVGMPVGTRDCADGRRGTPSGRGVARAEGHAQTCWAMAAARWAIGGAGARNTLRNAERKRRRAEAVSRRRVASRRGRRRRAEPWCRRGRLRWRGGVGADDGGRVGRLLVREGRCGVTA
eukprot:780796-Prymnesium_polylepis.1